MLDRHSTRGRADLDAVAQLARDAGAAEDLAGHIAGGNTVDGAFDEAQAAGLDIGNRIAALAWQTAAKLLLNPNIALEIIVFDREGRLRGKTTFTPSDHSEALPP